MTQSNLKKHLIVILGPTGAGKTSVSIALAKHFKTEVISSDSRQIYKGMVIGTAAITPDEQEGVPHHFVGTLDISESFNAFEYEQQALEVISKGFEEHDTLVMCGGSMMYIDAVCKGIDKMPDVDLNIRDELKLRCEQEGVAALSAELKRVDKEYYHSIDAKNPARVIHGLEVYLTTGKPISSFRKNTPKERPFKITKVGITLPREELYERINLRVDKMLEVGLIDEARQFYPYRHYNSLKTVGYRELFEHFDGKIPVEESVRLIKRNSRHYAKKQLTWFRKDESTEWFSPFDTDAILSYLNKD